MWLDGVPARMQPTRRGFLAGAVALGLTAALPRSAAAAAPGPVRQAAADPQGPTALPWHLTARPWQPAGVDVEGFLDVGESIARAHARRQGLDGAILDLLSGRDQQYTTPYFAASVAILVSNGRARDLLPRGIAAMERATAVFARGRVRIPDDHGEFFVAALATALPLYEPLVPAVRHALWRQRLGTPLSDVMRGPTHNWRSYAMKGEWLRARAGWIDRDDAVAWIEQSWKQTQRDRLIAPWGQYRDGTSDPDTHVYDVAARSNLFAMVLAGYDGPSRAEMIRLLQPGGLTSLLMQEPSGQNPAGGRSGDHVWNDVYSGEMFAQLAEFHRTTDERLAGQYRHAALLNLAGIDRWRREDGTYSVTKNHFDPAERVGYAEYSWFQNYNGNVMFHALETHELSGGAITEQPVPAEIGGYAFATDPDVFASAFANAGGMHMQASMAGSTEVAYGQYWTVLGVSRFGRTGWDGRLGPSDGVRDPSSSRAASFAPAFQENGTWWRLADLPARYRGTPSFEFVHPLLVRWAIDYTPTNGRSGPTLRHEFVMTPDGVLATTTAGGGTFGTTLPVVENDGRALDVSYDGGIASLTYPDSGDEQHFIAVQADARLDTAPDLIRGAVGDIRPVRLTVPGAATNEVFVYPRSEGDPSAADVRTSFRRTGDDFSTTLGRVSGTTYVGRTSAGGLGAELDLDGDGVPDVRFDAVCQFVLQLAAGTVIAVETDRAVTGTVQGRPVSLQAHTPLTLADAPAPGLTVVASSAQSGRPAASVLDGNPATRWSASGLGQHLTLDLGSVRTLSTLRLAWYRGDVRAATFDIEVSTDGRTFDVLTAGVRSSGGTVATEDYPLGGANARFVRVVNRGNTENTWIALTAADVVTG